AAAEFGTIPVLSSNTEPDLEVSAAASDSPKIFQLYVRGDMAFIKDLLARVKAAGYVALALTVDTAVGSRRERPMMSTGYATPSRSYRSSAQMSYQAQLTWESMDQIRDMAGLPFMLKGIQ